MVAPTQRVGIDCPGNDHAGMISATLRSNPSLKWINEDHSQDCSNLQQANESGVDLGLQFPQNRKKAGIFVEGLCRQYRNFLFRLS